MNEVSHTTANGSSSKNILRLSRAMIFMCAVKTPATNESLPVYEIAYEKIINQKKVLVHGKVKPRESVVII